MSDERHEAADGPAAPGPGAPPPVGWSERLRAELVAAARRQAAADRTARRRLICRHRDG